MSSTSSSRVRKRARCVGIVAPSRRPLLRRDARPARRNSASASADAPRPRSRRRRPCRPARTRPGSDGPTRAGARCTRAGCSPSSRSRSSPSSSARTSVAPVAHRRDRRLRQRLGVDVPLVGQVRLDHHARSGRRAAPCGCAARSCRASRAPPAARRSLARREAVEAVQRRASRRARRDVRQAVEEGLVVRRAPACASTSSTLICGRSCRRPTSKSLKSCAGVIFTAPVPFSGSEYSSATIGMRRPTSGRIDVLADRDRL